MKNVRIRPDIVAMKDGKIYFIEVKYNTRRLTKGQKRLGLFNLKRLHNAGGKYPKAAYMFQQKIRISKRMWVHPKALLAL